MASLGSMSGLQGILANVGRSIGSHLETSSFARESGLSVPTTKKYLDTLFQSHLAFQLHGYQYGPAKRFVKAAKAYFADNGIISGLGLQLSQGQILENFVISELEKRRKLGLFRADGLFYYKSQTGREVDIVFESGGVVHAIEIKATRRPTPDHGVRAFMTGCRPRPGAVFTWAMTSLMTPASGPFRRLDIPGCVINLASSAFLFRPDEIPGRHLLHERPKTSPPGPVPRFDTADRKLPIPINFLKRSFASVRNTPSCTGSLVASSTFTLAVDLSAADVIKFGHPEVP